MKTVIYNQEGKKAGDLELSETVFGLPWNADLVHQVSVSMMSNKRAPIAHTKGRGDVAGTGKKPWRQKGTGRARHGSRRSPIWIGGGVTFGPTKDRNFEKKINKKMAKKAFYTVISQKLRDNEIIFLDNADIKDAKTKEAAAVIKNISKVEGFERLATKRKNKAILALGERNAETKRSFKNIPGMQISEARNLNILDLLNYKYIVIPTPKETLAVWK